MKRHFRRRRQHHKGSIVAGILIAWAMIVVGYALVAIDLPSPPQTDPQVLRWVRTADGWEKNRWEFKTKQVGSNLHPVLLASFVGLATMLGLVAFPSAQEHEEQERLERAAAEQPAKKSAKRRSHLKPMENKPFRPQYPI